MRGQDSRSGSLFAYVDLEQRIRSDHPLRTIRTLVDEALSSLDGRFGEIYSEIGRPSIPPEQLLRAMLLQAFYSVRSERQSMERLDLDLLFRWFVGLGIDEDFQAQGRHAARQPRATPRGGRNADVDFHGKPLSNEAHQSTTDPEARLYRKGKGREAKLRFKARALMENRNGLIEDGCVTQAGGRDRAGDVPPCRP